MKKLILLLSLIITLIGCGGNSDHKQDKIENIITKEVYASSNFWSSKLFNKAKYFEVIENQSDYELFVDALNGSLSEIKESKAISKTTIDFDKNYLLVYATKYNAYEQIDEYKEYITMDENLSATIEQRFTTHKKNPKYPEDIQNSYVIAGVQVRVYQISKEINFIKMIHEDEISNISKEYPNGIEDTRVINLLNIRTSENKTLLPYTIKLFDTNSSFQKFTSNHNISINIENINFDNYRILFHSLHNGCDTRDKLYLDVEDINFYDNSSVTMIQKQILPKDISMMILAVCLAATEEQVRVYKISRDIESIKVINSSTYGQPELAITADEAI